MGTCENSRTLRQSSMPSVSGMARSVITMSGVHSCVASSAFFAENADCTVNPAASSARFSTRTICCSSSTTKIFVPFSVMLCFSRHGEAYSGAAMRLRVFDPDLAAVRLHDSLRDREPHPQATDCVLWIGRAKEALENLLSQRRWDPRTFVFHAKNDRVTVGIGRDHDGASRRRVLHGVVQHSEQHLGDQLGVGA